MDIISIISFLGLEKPTLCTMVKKFAESVNFWLAGPTYFKINSDLTVYKVESAIWDIQYILREKCKCKTVNK